MRPPGTSRGTVTARCESSNRVRTVWGRSLLVVLSALGAPALCAEPSPLSLVRDRVPCLSWHVCFRDDRSVSDVFFCVLQHRLVRDRRSTHALTTELSCRRNPFLARDTACISRSSCHTPLCSRGFRSISFNSLV